MLIILRIITNIKICQKACKYKKKAVPLQAKYKQKALFKRNMKMAKYHGMFRAFNVVME